MNTKKIINYSMLLAMSVVLGIIDSFIPVLFVGFKLGLANIVIIYTLYKFGFKDAIIISLLRVVLVSILRTGLFSITFYFSITGAFFSIIMMYLFKFSKLSIIGVSIIGSISHIIGQVIIAYILLNTISIFMMLPYLIIISSITGLIIGIISLEIIEKVKI